LGKLQRDVATPCARETTTDAALNGTIQVRQPRGGYRFSIDAFLLAGFISPMPKVAVLDLGTGCGIIPLIVAQRCAGMDVFGVEIQPELAELARENIRENGMASRVTIFEMDLKQLNKRDLPGPVGLVVSNPPFRECRTGRINPDSQRAIARHELRVTLPELVAAAQRVLDPGGRFATIYPSERLVALFTCLRQHRLEPKRLRMVHSDRSSEAKRCLVESVREGRPGLRVAAPLAVYRANGDYSAEVVGMLRGLASNATDGEGRCPEPHCPPTA
jgi:tRNA1Val (adenine37-N6)-methyltransferase